MVCFQMLKARNKGNMLLKIRMFHAVHLARLKLQTKAEDKTEKDSDCSIRNVGESGRTIF